jgi:hypothetical protein
MSLDPSDGSLHGNRYFSNSITGSTSDSSKMFEQDNFIYSIYRKSYTYISKFDMSAYSFVASIKLQNDLVVLTFAIGM